MGSAFRNLTVCAAITLASSGVLADVEAGKQAYQAGDYATALAEWRWDASQGNATALMGLGRMAEQGQGIVPDPYTAFVLYRVALAQGAKPAEQAANRVAGLLPGPDLTRGLDAARRLVNEGQYVPPLPGVAPASAPKKPAPPASVAKAAPAKNAPPAKPAPAPVSAAPAAPAATAAAKIEYRNSCNLTLRWQDKGSGGIRDLALLLAEPEPGFFIIGGYAQTHYGPADDCSLTVRAEANLLVAPAGWDRVWKDKGTGAHMDGSIWRALSPDADHVCLGDVGKTGKKGEPVLPLYRCVHRCMVTSMKPAGAMWTTEGTGANMALAVYRLPNAKTFVAANLEQPPAQVLDLNPDATCP